MQEYQTTIQKSLTAGLRPRNDTGRNLEFLTQSSNMKPLSMGLRSSGECTNPFLSKYFHKWPFPQLFRTANETILVDSTNVYPVTESDSSYWTRGASYTTYDLENPAELKAITEDGLWHCIDLFGSGWILLNGTSTVFKLGLEVIYGADPIIYCHDKFAVNTGCATHGRVYFGGFSASVLFDDAWQGVWSSYLDTLPISPNQGFGGSNFIFWSSIGGGDVLLPFAPGILKDGFIFDEDPDEYDEEFFLTLFKRNELGILPMPWQGAVLCIKPLGNGVMVYGEDGIAYLDPKTEPITTVGFQGMANFGISTRGSVGGDERSHVFVDTNGDLWNINASLNLRKLGYKEFLKGLQEDDMAISRDAEEDEFLISGKESSYILTPQGLGEYPQIVTSAVKVEGVLCGIFEERSSEVIIASDIIDFGYRDLKTITTVEIGCAAGNPVYVAIDYKYNQQDTWQRSPWTPLSPEGFARPQVSAVDARVVVKTESFEGFNLDYINVRWQTAGRRTVRGLNASTTNA